MTSSKSFLKLEHVSVARGATIVLHDLSLRVAPGEHIAILGPNGCGKSTLIKLMTCELYPIVLPGASVEIFGRSRWNVAELRRRLGVVTCETPPESALDTSAMDVVLTGFFSSSTLWPNLTVTADMRSAAAEALEYVGGTYLADRPLGQLSAGQQKRVLIARALVGSGTSEGDRVLLLDEPSNALDLAAQAELRLTMRNLAKTGTGIILVTHHIADIVPEINRVLMMREGHLIADGPREVLLTEEKLSELFETPVNLSHRDGYLHAW